MSATIKRRGLTITQGRARQAEARQITTRGPVTTARKIQNPVVRPKVLSRTPVRTEHRGPTRTIPRGRGYVPPAPRISSAHLLQPLLAEDRDDYAVEVSVVLGTYNRLPLLQRCVASIRKAAVRVKYEIVIADGGSTDGTAQWLLDQKDVVVVDGGLQGAVKAFNAAFQASRGRYVLALNDDAVLYEDTITKGLRHFADPFVGQVAFQFDEGGRSKLLTVYDKLYANFGMARSYLLRAIAKICGGMWADCYYTYGGDSELSCWVWRLGYKVLGAKDARVKHDEHPDELRRTNLKRDVARKQFFHRWPSTDRLVFRGPEPRVRPHELAELRRLERGETPQERWPRIEVMDPKLGEFPPARAPAPERVLHLHLWTDEDPQASLAASLEKVGSAGHVRIDWTKMASTADRDRAMLEAAAALRPTLVFLQLQAKDVVSAKAVATLRENVRDPSLVVCVWSGDVGPTNGPWPGLHDGWSYEIANHADLMLFTGTGQVAMHRERGMRNAAYLQIGYDEDRYYPGDEANYGSKHNLVFLGNSYSRIYDTLPDSEAALRREAVAKAKAIPGFAAYGGGWGGKGMPQTEAGSIYRASAMAMSISLTSKLARYTSDRLIRAMACGCPVLVKRFADMEGMGLVDGVNCVGWDTTDEMVQQAKSWLAPPRRDELRGLGRAGAELMQTRHTWSARMQELAALVAAVRRR